MKTKTTLLLFFVFIYLIGNSQELPSPRISLQFGMAMPMSELAATDPDLISSGFAETGFGAAIEGIIFVDKYLATGLRFGGSFIKSKDDLSGLVPDSNASLKADGLYKIQNVMIGLYYIRTLGQKFSVIGKLMTGVVFATTPEYKLYYEFEDTSKNYDLDIRGGSTSGPGFLIGIGGIYSLGKIIDLSLNLDYNYSKPEFDRTLLGERIKYKQRLVILGVNVGIAFKLK